LGHGNGPGIGDASLALLPFDEPYRIPAATAGAILRAHQCGGRVIAVGTTVVRALEHAASGEGCVAAGEGLATQRIGFGTRLRVVDAILSGTYERGTSHYELLGAFADAAVLQRMDEELDARGYRTHEFGDSVFVVRGEGSLCQARSARFSGAPPRIILLNDVRGLAADFGRHP
jgi:S-adenosylmethionine:tRNA ribosyltransferase-isomerase